MQQRPPFRPEDQKYMSGSNSNPNLPSARFPYPPGQNMPPGQPGQNMPPGQPGQNMPPGQPGQNMPPQRPMHTNERPPNFNQRPPMGGQRPPLGSQGSLNQLHSPMNSNPSSQVGTPNQRPQMMPPFQPGTPNQRPQMTHPGQQQQPTFNQQNQVPYSHPNQGFAPNQGQSPVNQQVGTPNQRPNTIPSYPAVSPNQRPQVLPPGAPQINPGAGFQSPQLVHNNQRPPSQIPQPRPPFAGSINAPQPPFSGMPPGAQGPPGNPPITDASRAIPPFVAGLPPGSQVTPPFAGLPPGSQVTPPFASNPPAQPPFGNAPPPKINPDQIPSPVVVQTENQLKWDKATEFRTISKEPPPLASSYYLGVDDGNASPRFLRASCYNIPTSDDIAQATGLPISLIVQPFAELRSNEAPIEVVDCGENGPIRCNRCKSYMNPFCKWSHGGQKFICNICQFANEVPSHYFAHVDMNLNRVDRDQRPELRRGAYEFTATKDFCTRKAQPASFVFLLDVSWPAIQSGMLQLACQTLKEIIDLFPWDEDSDDENTPCKMGLVCYDKSLHYFNLSPSLELPQVLCVKEVDDSYVPLSNGFTVNPIESRDIITKVLDFIPQLFGTNRSNEACIGAAIKAVSEHMKKTGGRIVVLHSSLPNFGPGTLKMRDDPKLTGTDKEKTLFAPQDDFYRSIAETSNTNGTGIDLFLFPQSYIDVATLGCLTAITGGQSHSYPNFHAQRDGTKFAEELRRIVTRPFGFDAVLRVRCSTGLSVIEHYGNFFMRNSTDLEFGVIDSEKAFGVQFKNDGKIPDNTEVFFQIALVYTNAVGKRRIRVLNLSLTSTSQVANMFKFADMDATLNFLSKAAISKTLNTNLKEVRDNIISRCIQILAAYRKTCAATSSAGQLILPESLKLFPLYSLTLIKSRAFRTGLDINSDMRIQEMRYLRSMGVATSIAALYPRMLTLHDMTPEMCQYDPQLNRFIMPQMIRSSNEKLTTNGMFLIENTLVLYIWIGREVSPALLNDAFGVSSWEDIDVKIRQLPALNNPLSTQLRALLNHIQEDQRKGFYTQLQLIRQGDPMESLFMNLLVEDANNDGMGYVDHLCLIHRQIQNSLSE